MLPVTLPAAADPQHPRGDAGGSVTLNVIDQGPRDGLPVVLIHALGTDHRVFDALLPHLPPACRVVRLDQRGHGLSTSPPGPWTVADLAQDLLGVIAARGLERPLLVGLSLGGIVALQAAALAPQRTRGLVMIGSSHRIGSASLWQARIDAVRAQGMAAIAAAVMERWFPADWRAAHPAALALWQSQAARAEPEGYCAACAALRDGDLTQAAATLTVPTLLISGAADVATPPEAMAATAALIPGARLEVLEGIGHLPPVQAPQATARLIAAAVHGAPAADPRADALYDRGLEVRRAVLGAAHVARATAAAGPLDRDFQAWITQSVWGSIWIRPGLDHRTRSLLTVSLLAALGHDHELALHIRASRNTGASPQDLAEALLHTAVYAGVPAANHALAILKQVLAEAPAPAAATMDPGDPA